jgi:hypothetical protein
MLFDGIFVPNGVSLFGKCLQEKYFSDPLPPGVTRDRIKSLFTAPTEKGAQTKESFKLFLRVHVYRYHRKSHKTVINHELIQMKLSPFTANFTLYRR